MSEIDKLRAEIDKLEADNIRLKQSNSFVEGHKARLRTDCFKLYDIIATLKSKIRALEFKNQDLEHKVESLLIDITNVSSQSTEQIATLSEKNSRLETFVREIMRLTKVLSAENLV